MCHSHMCACQSRKWQEQDPSKTKTAAGVSCPCTVRISKFDRHRTHPEGPEGTAEYEEPRKYFRGILSGFSHNLPNNYIFD